MLSAEGIRASYGRIPILHGIDLEVAEGEFVGILGHNGMGKTTLLKTLIGLVKTTDGSITFEGEAITREPPHKRSRRGIGYVPQGREIFPQLTVEENLRIGLAARRDRVRSIPEQVFELFPVLKQMLQRRGGDLSGGQQQQLAIGRALVLEPRLLILDEPTEGIQPNIVHQIGDIILRLNDEAGVTILLVEQKLPFARRVASDFRILDKGRAVAGGAIDELSDDDIRDYLTV